MISLGHFVGMLAFLLPYTGPDCKSDTNIIRNNVSDDIIRWSPSYKLTFDDFKGTYNADLHYNKEKSIDTAALSAVNILYDFEVKDKLQLKIKAYAVFYRSKSFIKSPEAETLKHEQAHFDIAEIYALKLEKIANELNVTNSISSTSTTTFFNLLENTQKRILKECENKNKEFDVAWIGILTRQPFYNWIEQELKAQLQ